MNMNVGLSLGSVLNQHVSPSILAQLTASGALVTSLLADDLSRMFQDSAGQVPVSGPGDPVGLVLDGSQGMRVKSLEQSLGPELVTDSWLPINATFDDTQGSLSITANSDYGGIEQNISGDSVSMVLLRFRVLSGAAGQGVINIYDSSGATVGTISGLRWDVGDHEIAVHAVGISKVRLWVQDAGETVVFGEDVSVRAVQPLSERISGLGPQLAATIHGQNATNFVTDLGNHTFRFHGDGSSFTSVRFETFDPNEAYLIEPVIVSHTSGSLKGNDATDSDIHSAFSTTPAGKIWLPTNKIEFGRAVGGQAIDVTVQFVVRDAPGNHAVQSVDEDYRPTLGQDGAGHYYLEFDGVDDYLAAAFGETLSQPNTIAVAFERTSVSGDEYLFDGLESGNRHALFGPPGDLIQFAGASNSTTNWPTGPSVAIATFDGASSTIDLDGTTYTGDAGTLGLSGLAIGSRYSAENHLTGGIYGLVVVDRLLTDAEKSDLQAHLAQESGVSL